VTKQQVPLDASAGYFKPGQILLTSVYEHTPSTSPLAFCISTATFF
jgi:hypothetical protein